MALPVTLHWTHTVHTAAARADEKPARRRHWWILRYSSAAAAADVVGARRRRREGPDVFLFQEIVVMLTQWGNGGVRAGTVRPDYESRVLRMYGQWFDVTSTSFTCSLLHHTCQPHPDILHMNVSPPAISPRYRVLKHYNLANDINCGVVSGLGLRIELVSFFCFWAVVAVRKCPEETCAGRSYTNVSLSAHLGRWNSKVAHLGAAAVTRLMQVLAGWTPLERNETIASRESWNAVAATNDIDAGDNQLSDPGLILST